MVLLEGVLELETELEHWLRMRVHPMEMKMLKGARSLHDGSR